MKRFIKNVIRLFWYLPYRMLKFLRFGIGIELKISNDFRRGFSIRSGSFGACEIALTVVSVSHLRYKSYLIGSEDSRVCFRDKIKD